MLIHTPFPITNQIHEKNPEGGGVHGQPPPPDLGNAPIPGIHAYNVPDEAKELTGFPKMSKQGKSRPQGGGFTGNPPTPMPGGLARPET
jgi:hypothetical protein